MHLLFTVSSHAATFTVTTTADSGLGSLREAIIDANALAGADTIAFNIPGSGPHTIQPLSALPVITDPVVIEGYTQPGSSPNTLAQGDDAVLKIELDGSNAGPGACGLTVTAGGSTVRGLVVNRFGSHGVLLTDVGANIVAGNFIGTDVSGTVAAGNGRDAVGGGDGGGIFIGHWGPDLPGANVIGGPTPDARNVISGNKQGIVIAGSDDNQVQGNFIGTDLTGTAAIPNTELGGVAMWGGTGNRVGAPGAGNLISGNTKPSPAGSWDGGFGIVMWTGGAIFIEGNLIGTDVTGKVPLGNQTGLQVFANGGRIGGTAAGAGNVISGNSFIGLFIGGGCTVQGNRVGTDITGTTALGNYYTGISVQGENNLIGGTDPNARNLISGNSAYGIEIQGPHNQVQGNFIGTDVSGTIAIPNWEGIAIFGYSDNVVGGTAPGAGNLISGNGNLGVDIRSIRTKLQGNFIGTDVTGTQALGNSGGVFLSDGPANDNEIGGVEPGAGNLISGNRGQYGGIFFNGAGVTGNRVQGNLIGTDRTGTQPLGNSFGVAMDGSSNNAIGGTETGAGNVLASSEGPGIGLNFNCAGARVEGNFIGTDRSGTLDLGNRGGIWVYQGVTDTKLGGSEPGAANVIAFNRDCGVTVIDWVGQPASGTAIRGNSIHSNHGLGIDLSQGLSLDGPTFNDLGDADTGPNKLQNFPLITGVSALAGGTEIKGTLKSTPNMTFTLDFYANNAADPSGHGEGEIYLGAGTVTTGANGHVAFVLTVPKATSPGQIITATATDPDGNTSEFSGHDPLHLLSATANCILGLVRLEFDQPLDESIASDPAHYMLSDGLTVLSAQVIPNSQSVELSISAELTPGLTYTATVTDIVDILGNPIAPNSQAIFVCDGTITPDDLGASPPCFVIEAEDYDFAGGQTKPEASVMPYTGGAFAGLAPVLNVDYFNDNANNLNLYRPDSEPTNVDLIDNLGGRWGARRPGYDVVVNYRIGWGFGADWQNYTRDIPKGTYTVWAALSHASTADHQLRGRLSKVTSGVGTPNQTWEDLGTFDGSGTGAWQDNALVPMQGSNGTAAFEHSGGPVTLRFWTDSGDFDWFVLDPRAPKDTTPPQIIQPANLTVPCSANLLTPVTFSVTATDNSDPAPVVNCSPASGSGFPIGTTTVTCTATDASGNSSARSFTVTRAALDFAGFLSPIGGADATGGSFGNPVRTFKNGSTIPVKFTTSCDGAPVLTGIHRLQAVKYSDATTAAAPIDATPQDAATAGTQFRLAGSQWHFNLDTRAAGMTPGIWQLVATLSDGSQHTVWIALK